MNPQARREFVRTHRTAVFATRAARRPLAERRLLRHGRRDILVSTMPAAQGKSVRRNPKVSLCVLGRAVAADLPRVYCDGRVETDLRADGST